MPSTEQNPDIQKLITKLTQSEDVKSTQPLMNDLSEEKMNDNSK